jgi:hypothetical protein
MPVLSFKVDPAAARRIRANARADKTSVSAYLRRVALGEGQSKPLKIVRGLHPLSGLPYNAGSIGRKVTNEEIRAALADFP